MTPDELAEAIFQAASSVFRNFEQAETLKREQVTVERPKNREHGDWASNIAMQFAKKLGTNPRVLAESLAEKLSNNPAISAVQIAGPGFINITLTNLAAGQIVKTIVEAQDSYGQNNSQSSQSVNLEFVSANPTGPLHIGHTRWAALGDSLARILKISGAKIATEFYINDAGNQMDNFALSVIAAAKGEPTPENGYPGAYIQDLAKAALVEYPNLLELPDAEALELAREFAYQKQLAEIKTSLDQFRVHFDVYYSERLLHAKDPETAKSAIDTAVDRLRAQGHVYDLDGAVWVRTTEFGDDKDRVIRRANGIYTYFAADAAYYLNKSDRGFQEKIYLLGADHHGYVHRLKALAGAAGQDPEKDITVLIGQLVDLNGAKLSKRAGNIIELNDLMQWLGTDALRYWLARYPADSPISLDGEQLRSKTNDNPVFYVQYAHARTKAVDRNAELAGVGHAAFEPDKLSHPTETELIGKLAEYLITLKHSAKLREPHRIARYLEELASAYHSWYDNCRVIPQGDEPITALHQTRLWLNDATGVVLRNGLDLLGVSAPEKM